MTRPSRTTPAWVARSAVLNVTSFISLIPQSRAPAKADLSAPTDAQILLLSQGSYECDSSSPPERSRPVMLSAAKHLAASRDRPFASLRVTWCDCSNYQGLFFTLESCLKFIITPLQISP